MKQEIPGYSKTCGVAGCDRTTIVNIRSRNVTRCAEHFCQDLSDFKEGHRAPRITGRFHAPKNVMDTLKELNLIQGESETLREFGQRCHKFSLQNQGMLLPASLREKSGTQPAQS